MRRTEEVEEEQSLKDRATEAAVQRAISSDRARSVFDDRFRDIIVRVLLISAVSTVVVMASTSAIVYGLFTGTYWLALVGLLPLGAIGYKLWQLRYILDMSEEEAIKAVLNR